MHGEPCFSWRKDNDSSTGVSCTNRAAYVSLVVYGVYIPVAPVDSLSHSSRLISIAVDMGVGLGS